MRPAGTDHTACENIQQLQGKAPAEASASKRLCVDLAFEFGCFACDTGEERSATDLHDQHADGCALRVPPACSGSEFGRSCRRSC